MSNEEKQLPTLKELVEQMNKLTFANAEINSYGLVNVGREGRRYEGEAVAVDDTHYGVFLGNAFNPLLFRGENKMYPDFTPGIRRTYGVGTETEAFLKLCVDGLQKQLFVETFMQTPYYLEIRKIKMADYELKFDFEAIAQHYGFLTNYIDITTDLRTAMFFAYTYYDAKEEKYWPIEDFNRYNPMLYVADLRALYKNNEDCLQLIGFQAVLRPYRQKAMAMNCVGGEKSLFTAIELPKCGRIARAVWESFGCGKQLLPQSDPLEKLVRRIRDKKEVCEEFANRYCASQKNWGGRGVKEFLDENGDIVETLAQSLRDGLGEEMKTSQRYLQDVLKNKIGYRRVSPPRRFSY